ncbi:15128_t:CDS:1, partial [Funneliformis geosporum]
MIEFIGEIKLHGLCFMPTNQEQVIMYATIALKHQKYRQSITGFLTDCYQIMFIQVTKDDSEKGLQ